MAGGPTVTRSTIWIASLAIALVASNGWWLYTAVDAGVTASYREVSFRDHREALSQTLAVLPVAADLKATRADVLAAAAKVAASKTSFEKDGYVWVGRLGFGFDASGRVNKVAPAWDPY
jgi:cell wall-associated NlpC family hydrolase